MLETMNSLCVPDLVSTTQIFSEVIANELFSRGKPKLPRPKNHLRGHQVN